MTATTAFAFRSRLNDSVLAYWRERARGRPLPSRRDLDPVVDLADIARHLFLVDVEHDPLRFKFRLVGTEVVDHVGKDMTGRYLDELVDFDEQYETVKPDYESTVLEMAPSVRLVRFPMKGGNRYVNYERLLLPLSDDGRRVNMLLGTCSPLTD